MDFFQVKSRSRKGGGIEIYPDFQVCRSKDMMVRGKSFYAIWDREKGMWSTDEYDVQRFVDEELKAYADKLEGDIPPSVKYMKGFSSQSWIAFRSYVNHLSDNAHQLDERITFSNTEVKKNDYVSKRLSYPLEEGKFDAWEELISTLYAPEEREKLEWAIGAIVSGDARDIQKFVVLYGEAGTGKSTVLNVIQKLFNGYYTTFEAKALTNSNNTFSTEVFRGNPLVAIQHDGDLSRIEDNTTLNSIVSHEEIPLHEKFKPTYTARLNCFLFMGTNKPVKITDAKSGIIRRLIDVVPTGKKIPPKRYAALMQQIEFELGAIAWHCLEVYRELGKNYYSAYRPINMIFKTDTFFNFVEDQYPVYSEQDGVSLKAAYEAYKNYCEDSGVDSYRLPRYKFREELKDYFMEFKDIQWIDGKQVRSYYAGFRKDKFERKQEPKPEPPYRMVLDKTDSLLDILLKDCPAQYGDEREAPRYKWENVRTKLGDLNTKKLHYVNVPESMNMAMIDFDIRNDKGEKDFELNLAAASKWPATYAELSKGGAGIHLHYFYKGDLSKVSPVYAPGIEVKVFKGNASLRRRLSLCNDIPVATLTSGLPEKEEKVVNFEAVANEKALRTHIKNCLEKKHHGATKPEIDFIFKALEDAYNSGMHYDVTDLRPKILAFANNSSHQAELCVKTVAKMKWKSEEPSDRVESENAIVFFDVEVFPNLFLVNWKYDGASTGCVRMVNPTPVDIESLMQYRLIGFNCRRYDNHMLYARMLGKTNQELYELSKRIINGSDNAMFTEAYNVSYTDIYDLSSKKQSLKKWEIELGIHHKELGLPWDQPVPEEKWGLVAEYCDNDVMATEALWHSKQIQADWTARRILAQLSGLSVNDTTNQHTTRIIFGANRNPQGAFNYRFMGTVPGEVETYSVLGDEIGCDPEYTLFKGNRPIFPGYSFDNGKSLYRGEEVGEGGYVYAEPGVYTEVALLDIASMHPSSIVAEELFGEEYTRHFKDILDARIAIKHRDFEKARSMLGGKLAPFLEDESKADELASALKIAINSVYGLTSAKFSNPFRDIRNKDNIVAKRGALFMVNLKHEVQKRGFTVAHIKTDSIKIPNATPEIIQFVMEYGKMYGYSFEHESTYDRMCLVNDAVYIAYCKSGKHAGEWVATGAQFQHPYVYKTCFTKEKTTFDDICETKSVSTSIYLDYNENLPEGEHNYVFVGKVGQFFPVKPGCGGGVLLRENDGKYYAVTGTKGYRWFEAESARELKGNFEIDDSYHKKLVEEAMHDISQYEPFEWFVDLDTTYGGELSHSACAISCFECPEFHPMDSPMKNDIFGGTCEKGYM